MKHNLPLKLRNLGMLLIAMFMLNSAVSAQSKDEVINGSYFVAFGRFANSGEMTYWRQNVGSRSIADMVSNHRSYIKSNQNEREQTVRRSYMDAFGWQPSADELKYWSAQNKTYAELMANHVNNWLAVHADKRELVIRQSYYKVFGRNAYDAEVKYWKSQAVLPFVQLVAMHTTWKMKNQSSSTTTSPAPGLNTNGISTAGFSPQAANGVIAAGGGNVIAAGGGNVVAAGGANAVAAGGLN